MSEFSIRPARSDDIADLQPLIQRAYRGDSARAGWTHEADLLEGERIAIDELEAIVASPSERLLIGFEGDRMIGCVRVADLGGARAYLGVLCVDPLLQAAGYGRRLIAEAERTARSTFGATRIEMTVIDRRVELIAYYERRGYVAAGTQPFPILVDPPLNMVVLEKALR